MTAIEDERRVARLLTQPLQPEVDLIIRDVAILALPALAIDRHDGAVQPARLALGLRERLAERQRRLERAAENRENAAADSETSSEEGPISAAELLREIDE